MTKFDTPNWRDDPDEDYCVRVEFGDGDVAYTTIEKAADRLDFIDRELGIQDLKAGSRLRSHLGSIYQVVR